MRKKFGTAVKAVRQQNAWTQQGLADKAGLHRTYISDIERGGRNVSLDSILKVATALNRNVSDLFLIAEGKVIIHKI